VPSLISFDIDGTLEVGDPPGLISVEMVRQVKRIGCLIGSCSDRPISYQQRMWSRLQIAADFTVLKHRLADVKTRFPAEGYYHIGDTDVDHSFASKAGFRFFRADATVLQAWGPELFL
jgi:hypothetical protein